MYIIGLLGLSYASLFFIFFDYNKTSNVWKSVLFLGLVISGISTVTMLIAILGPYIMYTIPLFAVFPFLVAVIGKKKPKL